MAWLFRSVPVFCALAALRGGSAPAAPLEVLVAAGAHSRRDVPVSLELDASAGDASGPVAAVLREVTGGRDALVPAQVEPPAPGARARVHWVLSGETPAGKARNFILELKTGAEAGKGAGGPPAAGALSLEDDGKRIVARLEGRSVLAYNHAKVAPPAPEIPPLQTRNAYLHPLWSPSGQVLTMDYPRNHLHHRGVWFPWVHTEFEGRRPDFWNLGDGTGTVEFESLESTYRGPVFAGFRARHRHLDLKAPDGPRAALRERWDVRVYAVGGEQSGYFLFDLDSIQECAGSSPLHLEEYRYGGLGLRGSWDWEGDAVRIFTSEGKGRLNGEGSRARWFDMSGPVGGRWAGMAVLGHPSNFRSPQPLRVHPSEPFVNFAPVKAGDFEIVPGKPYRSRYRFYLHDGVLRADEADRLWTDYAEPPEVKLVTR